MKTRFEGTEGRRLLVEVLQTQRLVEYSPATAERLAADGEVVEFRVGDTIVHQDSTGNDVYFIIDGEAGVVVNGRKVATRQAKESIGEMALVDGSARRSATVTALKPVCALKVSEPAFRAIATDHPLIWRAIACVVADRLRQRVQFHQPPNERPTLFLGSSVEGLPVAKQVQLGLKHTPLTVQLWTSGVFGPGGVAIDSLISAVDRSDFAAFVFGPDDKVTSRAAEYLAPRDNVVFELGLFMGRLNRDRCFLVREHSTDIKVPSDLLGITPITYVLRARDDLPSTLATVCTELEEVIGRLGVK